LSSLVKSNNVGVKTTKGKHKNTENNTKKSDGYASGKLSTSLSKYLPASL